MAVGGDAVDALHTEEPKIDGKSVLIRLTNAEERRFFFWISVYLRESASHFLFHHQPDQHR
ncbi:MAG: hypothetical protein WBO46_18620 [Caldilineaceae bacterium]